VATAVDDRTYKATVETVTRLAEESFRHHELKVLGDGRWRCGRPGSSIYAFIVITHPGALIVLGDLGELVLRFSEADSLGWLRGSVRDREYLLSKVTASKDPPKEFYPADALQVLRGWADDDDHRGRSGRSRYRNILEDAGRMDRLGDLNEHTWAELMNEHSVDDGWSVARRWSAQMLWFAEALKLFSDKVSTLDIKS
jgi:hypothetical protein